MKTGQPDNTQQRRVATIMSGQPLVLKAGSYCSASAKISYIRPGPSQLGEKGKAFSPSPSLPAPPRFWRPTGREMQGTFFLSFRPHAAGALTALASRFNCRHSGDINSRVRPRPSNFQWNQFSALVKPCPVAEGRSELASREPWSKT